MEYPLNNVSIERLYKSERGKDGKSFISSKGNPFKKVDIYIDARAIPDPDFKGKISYFDYYDNTSNWGQGTTITGVVAKNGNYFNFQLPPSGKKALDLDIKELQSRVEKLEAKVFGKINPKEEEEEDIKTDIDELPF